MFQSGDLQGVKTALLEQHKSLTKMVEQFTKGDFQERLRDAMYEQNKAEEKKGKVKKMEARIILTKTGEVVFKFADEKNGKKFFDTI